MKNTNKKGFTIIELAIVIAVIAILAAVLIPTFSGIIEKANVSSAEQAARNAYTQYVADKAASGNYAERIVVKTSDDYYVFLNNGSVIKDKDGLDTTKDLTKLTNVKFTAKYKMVDSKKEFYYDVAANSGTINDAGKYYYFEIEGNGLSEVSDVSGATE